MKAVGIDVGSLTTKAVILDGDRILASSVVSSVEEAEASARSALDEALKRAGLASDSDLYIVATGAGGKSVPFSQKQKTATTCLARGVNYLLPAARMAIEMGAESSVVITLNERGRISDWATHDKCAAGTGIFLQQMAKLMRMSLAEMSKLSLQAKAKAEISNTCAVFAESEVISHVHRVPPTPMEEIAAGIYASVVSRIMALCKRVGIKREVAVVGGVALNRGLVRILEEELGFRVLVPDSPQTSVALGAALIARESIDTGAK